MPSSSPSALPAPSFAAPDLAVVQAIERHSLRAWPAPEAVVHGGWVFRLARGFTKRANSANATQLHPAFDGVQAAAEALYARHGLPAIFRISPLAPPEADTRLQDAGYARFDSSRVLARALGHGLPWAESGARVEIAARPSAGWLDGFAAANGVAAWHQSTHHAMVRTIAGSTGFATVRGSGGEAMGFGLAVREGDTVGFYDIVVAPAHRRQGHGMALMLALMHWALADGAQRAYLQVRDQNEAARRLYAGLGFADLYAYHYRVPAGT